MLTRSSTMRLFFGVSIPEDLALAFRTLILKENPQLQHHVRWTRAGNHHITVRFLGNIAEQKVPKLIDSIGEAIEAISPFQVILRNINLLSTYHGKFGAVHIQPCVELQSLYDAIDLVLATQDFSSKGRPYMPHITLFRSIKHQTIEFEKISLSNDVLDIKELILFQSIPIEKGTRYVPLHKFTL